jgi:hypothetical protein
MTDGTQDTERTERPTDAEIRAVVPRDAEPDQDPDDYGRDQQQEGGQGEQAWRRRAGVPELAQPLAPSREPRRWQHARNLSGRRPDVND